MEPPAKRRRKSGPSPLDNDDDDGDSDELSHQPYEVLAKRDSGYRLSLERAQADQRFQATMAHIFEKYGRDFEGVGDEIDMMTGEIIVDNGHLHNMRNEGDVGVLLENASIDEDEGVLLEDLVDDDDDYPRFVDEGSGADNMFEGMMDESSDLERLVHGHETSRYSSNLVPSARSLASSKLSGLLSGLPESSRLGRTSSPWSFGHTTLPFGASPLAMGPWELPDDFSQPVLPPGQAPTPRRAKVKRFARKEMYDFPVQDGRSSIWALRSKYQDDEEAAVQNSNTTSKQSSSNVRAPRRGQQRQRQRQQPSSIDGTFMRSDGDEALNENSVTTKLTPNKPEGPPTSTGATNEGNGQRRRSGRQRRKVEYMGKISWSEILETGVMPEVAGQLSTVPPEDLDDDRVIIQNSKADKLHSSGVAKATRDSEGNQGEFEMAAVRCIPDSQDTQPPSSDMRPPENAATAEETERTDKLERQDVDSACVLSDDESPVFLSKPKVVQPAPPAHPIELHAVLEDAGGSSTDEITESQPQQADDESDTEENALVVSHSNAIASQLHYPVDADSPPVEMSHREQNSDERPGDEPLHMTRCIHRGQKTKEIAPQDVVASQPVVGTLPAEDLSEAPNTEFDSEQATPQLHVGEIGKGAEEPVHMVTASEQETDTHTEPLPAPRPLEHDMDTHVEEDPGGASEKETDTQVEVVPNTPLDPVEPLSSSKPALINGPKRTPSHSPTKIRDGQATSASPNMPELHTPRRSIVRSNKKVPSSRRSILSLVSEPEEHDDRDDLSDELGWIPSGMANLFGSTVASRRVWKSSALTTEVYRTPVKKRPADPVSPSSVVRTPGGTTRACGLDGFRCGRDFCFTCL